MKDPRWTQESDWLVGAAIGSGAVLLLVVSLDFSVRNNIQDNWAILLAATATIVAGVGGGVLAWKSAQRQVENQNRLAQEEKGAKIRAAKSMLPSILAELSRRCEHNAFTVLLNSRSATDGTSLPDHLKIYIGAEIKPFLEGHEFQTLKDCIEYADIEDAQVLQHIVRRYQIYFSRCHAFDFPEVTYDSHGRVLDSTSLQLAEDWNSLERLTAHCLRFARAESVHISRDFKTALLHQAFSSARASEVTLNPKILSTYKDFSEQMAEKIKLDLQPEHDTLKLDILFDRGIL